MSILTFEANIDRIQWRFKLRRAKYRFLKARLNMLYIYLYIYGIYIASLQGNYSEALPA